MRLKAGFEEYIKDQQSHVKKLAKHWWHDLDEGIQAEKLDVQHKFSALRVRALETIDWVIRTSVLAYPNYKVLKNEPENILKDRAQWPFYHLIAQSDDPSTFFVTPTIPEKKEITKSFKKTISGGGIHRISFKSNFVPVNPFYSEDYWDHHVHDNIEAELWLHDGEPRPTVLVIHGYGVESYALNRRIFSVAKHYESGCNVCLVNLPFHHGRRAITQKTVLNYFSRGPAFSSEVFANAVFNCRSMMTYLLDNNIATKISVTGLSLGAYVGSLLAGADERVENLILLAPVYNLPDSLFEWFPVNQALNQIMKTQDVTLNELRHTYALCNSLTYQPKLPPENILILSGVYDLIALPKYVRLLGEHWNQCKIRWFSGSHVALPLPMIFKETQSLMLDNGFLSEPENENTSSELSGS